MRAVLKVSVDGKLTLTNAIDDVKVSGEVILRRKNFSVYVTFSNDTEKFTIRYSNDFETETGLRIYGKLVFPRYENAEYAVVELE